MQAPGCSRFPACVPRSCSVTFRPTPRCGIARRPVRSATRWKACVSRLSSGYLGRLALYVLLYAVTGTLVWMQQQSILRAEFAHLGDAARASRTQVSGTIDFYANVLTAVLQLFIAGRVIRWIGVSASPLTPLTTLASLSLLYFSPTVAMLIPVQVARRGIHYAVDRPAREVLYTVVTPAERYKSKNLIDTFVYRFGDAVGGWSECW